MPCLLSSDKDIDRVQRLICPMSLLKADDLDQPGLCQCTAFLIAAVAAHAFARYQTSTAGDQGARWIHTSFTQR
jgi:ferredoxin-thioredoxin reductase catalytic subunit